MLYAHAGWNSAHPEASHNMTVFLSILGLSSQARLSETLSINTLDWLAAQGWCDCLPSTSTVEAIKDDRSHLMNLSTVLDIGC